MIGQRPTLVLVFHHWMLSLDAFCLSSLDLFPRASPAWFSFYFWNPRILRNAVLKPFPLAVFELFALCVARRPPAPFSLFLLSCDGEAPLAHSLITLSRRVKGPPTFCCDEDDPRLLSPSTISCIRLQTKRLSFPEDAFSFCFL